MRTLLVLVAMTSFASAQPPSAVEPTPRAQPKLIASYPRQTLIADGLAIGMVAAGAATGSRSGESLALLGVGTYVLGTPFVHVSKRRFGHAFISVVLRVGIPLAGMKIGHSIDSDTNCDPDWLDCYAWSDGETGGFLLGIAAVIAHDAIFLADGDDPPEAPPRVTPSLRATQGGATVGIGGYF